MKKRIIAFFLGILGLAGFAGNDSWEITKVDSQAYISDGDWTFKATLRTTWHMRDPRTGEQISSAPIPLFVQDCTDYPDSVMALDFSKPLVNSMGDGKEYLIEKVSPCFGTVTGNNQNRVGTAKDSGDKVGKLIFPTHDYRFEIGDISYPAFAGCTNLVFDLSDLPTNTVFVNRNVFLNSSITGATREMPYLTELAENSFGRCAGITGFYAPNVTKVGSSVFYNCTSLKTVRLGNYTKLTQYAFGNCTALECVSPFLGDSCEEFEKGVFQNCSSLTNALIAKVTKDEVGVWECFDGCAKIPSVDYSESQMKEIARRHFCNCSSVTVLKLPSTICQLAVNTMNVFAGMTFLNRLEMRSSVDGFLNQFPAETTALSEIHFYNCSPKETTSVLANIDASQVVTTYLHDMTDAQLTEWAACTEGGELSASSTWSKALAGESKYLNRPLVVYVPPHAQIAAGVNAVVLNGQTGTFTVSRGAEDPVAGDLVVNYTVSGEAEAGTHYDALSGSVTIPHGESSATVSVTGRYLNEDYNKSLTLTLSTGDYEIIEGKSSATISVIGGCRNVGIARVQDADYLAGQSGSFLVSRGESDPCVGDLVVNYSTNGTAVAGVDYTSISGSIIIPDGESSVTISVDALYTGEKLSKELVLTLTASDEYRIVADKASATISVTSGYRGVGVTKLEDANKQQGKVGSFRVSRGDDDSTNNDFTVTLAYSGSATNGTTYREVPTSVTIPAGKRSVDFEIFPLDDAGVTADSEAIVSVVVGDYSTIGDPATITIEYGTGVWGCWHIIDADGKKITDGVWTFNVTLHGISVASDTWRMDVKEVMQYPTEVSPLDFTKGTYFIYDNKKYEIVNWSMVFGNVDGNAKIATATEAGTNVGYVALSSCAAAASIGANAFAGCKNMTFDLANLPTNLVTIGSCAFTDSSASGAVSAPNLTTLSEHAFRRCTGLISFGAPKLATIGSYAFDGATGLVSVDLGQDADCKLTSIGQYAFNGCSALESFTPFLPSSLDKLESRAAFMGCASLTNALVFKGSNLGEEFTGWGGTQLFRECAKIPSADLSASTITAIRREVFYGCTSLRDVKLPPTLVEFGNPKTAIDSKTYYPNINADPFQECSGIKLYINSGEMPVKNGSSNVTDPLNIPEVTDIVIGAGVTNIEDGAFSKAEYSGLTNITFLAAKPATLGADLFANQKASKITVYVPYEYLESWKPVADGGVIKRKMGTWTSGTTQLIRAYWLKTPGTVIIFR